MTAKPFAPFLLSILSGALLALSLPPYDLSFLAWFVLVPLLLAAKTEDRTLEIAGRGLLVGLIAGTIHARFSGGLFLVFAYLPFAWFGVLCAIFAVASHQLRHEKPLTRVAMLACVGVASEWLTTLTPLPINFAVTQYRVLDLIQIADITGIWGVSFLLWFANAAIANAIISRREPLSRRAAVAPLAISLLSVFAAFVYSSFRLYQPQTTKTIRVAAVQAFEPNGAHGFADAVSTDSKLRESLTRNAVAQGARLVVWSEETLGSDFQPRKNDDATRQLARQLGTTIVAGWMEENDAKQWNSAALVAPNGDVASVHRKIHLYAGERSSTTAGTTPTVIDTDLGKIGIAICFDTCWTNVLRAETKNGAQIIAMPNFDPPVPRGVVHFLHGAMLPFRAVENRVPIVRADPNGHSGVVTAQGRVLDSRPLQRADVSVRDVFLGYGKPTFFARFGDWLAWTCVLITAISSVILLRRALLSRQLSHKKQDTDFIHGKARIDTDQN